MSKGLASEFDEFLGGEVHPPDYKPPASAAPSPGEGRAPQYRPPPAYPFDSILRNSTFLGDTLSHRFDGSLRGAMPDLPSAEFGPDGYITTTVTTTTTTRFGLFKPAPPYIRPPDYASAMHIAPSQPDQAMHFMAFPDGENLYDYAADGANTYDVAGSSFEGFDLSAHPPPMYDQPSGLLGASAFFSSPRGAALRSPPMYSTPEGYEPPRAFQATSSPNDNHQPAARASARFKREFGEDVEI